MKTVSFTMGLTVLACAAGCGAAGPEEEESDPLILPATSPMTEPLVSPVPSPSDVYIESVSAGGPGCPEPGSLTTLISPDRTGFLIVFDQMTLEIPPPPAVKHTSCVAGVRVRIPRGWQFSVTAVDTRGYAFLSNRIRALQTSEYHFAGVPLGEAYPTTLVGVSPHYDAYYSFTDVIPVGSRVWSPCGDRAIFAVDTDLRVDALLNPHGHAIFNTRTLDGKLTKIVRWQWKKC